MTRPPGPVRGAGTPAAPQNPLALEDDVLQRFRCVYEETNTQTRGPLAVGDDAALAAAAPATLRARLHRGLTRRGRAKATSRTSLTRRRTTDDDDATTGARDARRARAGIKNDGSARTARIRSIESCR